jgi:hypothetical protein
VEAVRMFAAAHDGKLPASLNDIKDVPIPVDPQSGKAFEYKVEDNVVTLFAPTPPGEAPYVGNTRRFVVTFRK